jgi:NACHT domain/Pentapeptide repeats (8 copies)
MIQCENCDPDSRFRIQVWGPDEGVRELFALEPEAYRVVYDDEPPPVDPEKVVTRWADRLKPVLRLPVSLSNYLSKPRSHCITGEGKEHFEEVFEHAIELEAADPGGAPLGRLRDVLDNWLEDPAQRTLLLLGEFGDGKSFESYRLTRRLAVGYGADPSGYFPLRLPLRELRSAGSPQALLARRLQALNATVGEWEDLPRTLVVLDGFDEMSVQIDHATVAENLGLLADCVDHFAGSKLLVTSRTHFFETGREQARFLEQLEDPQVVRLVPIRRSTTNEHLDAYARRHRLSAKLQRMRCLYDPIGLAAKPLYLQMMKETLPVLPNDHFDEIVLYDTNVRDSLKRKAKLLEDKNMRTLRGETLRGMIELLEALAVGLFMSGGEAVDLRSFGDGKIDIAGVLWKMSQADASAEQSEDARARLGVRSLLKPAFKADEDQSWPVTFCHRSMYEYFLARAVAQALGAENDGDLAMARSLLGSAVLGPEIVHFVTLLVHKTPDAGRVARILEKLTSDAAKGTGCGYLGGNAITLAFCTQPRPAHKAWRDLDLSYADLSGADLAGADFRDSLLRYATLDNADLSYADLRNCDLTGVQLEETAQVIDVAPGQDENRILASYGDGSIREWLLGGSRPSSEKLLDGLGELKAAAWGPYGDLLVVDGSRLLVAKAGEHQELRIRGDIDSIRLARDVVSFTCAGEDHRIAMSFDCQTASADATVRLAHTGPVAFAGDDIVMIPLGKNAVGIAQLRGADPKPVEIPVADVTAAAMRYDEPGEIRLALADSKGKVTCLEVAVNGDESRIGTGVSCQLHRGPGLAATFLSKETVVFGSSDRDLVVCDWDQDGLRIRDRLKLTLRCVGIKTAGVQGDRERLILDTLRQKAEELLRDRGSG